MLGAAALCPSFRWLEGWCHRGQASVVSAAGHRALRDRMGSKMYSRMGQGTGIQDKLKGGSSRDGVEA